MIQESRVQDRWYAGRGMQEKRDARQEGYRTRGMQDRREAGKEGCRKVGMKGRRDEERRYEEKGGIHHKIGTR